MTYLLCTTRFTALSSFPRIFLAMHLYFPASSRHTSSICISPSDVTLVLLLGNVPFIRDQATCGAGFPEAEHSSDAVVFSFTVSWKGETVTFGAEMDSPGSPFTPGIPGAPISPLIPFSPLIPGGPIIPCFPLLPGCPITPWEPFLPLFPGGPGIPRGQKFKLPLLWQIFLKLEVTTSSKTSFRFAVLLSAVLATLRVNLRSSAIPFPCFLSSSLKTFGFSNGNKIHSDVQCVMVMKFSTLLFKMYLYSLTDGFRDKGKYSALSSAVELFR